MAALPWFPFDREAYISNTMHLTTEEHGAYLLLMLTYYGTGKPLPGYERALASIAKVSLDRWAIISVALKPFFIEDTTEQGSIWRHERIEAELLAASSKHAAAVAKATAAAQARHGKPSSAPAKSVLQAVVEQPPSRKRAPRQPAASSEDAPSTPQASSSSPHLHIHTTLSNERVVAPEAPENDDARKAERDSREAQAIAQIGRAAIASVKEPDTFNPLGTTLAEDWTPSNADQATANAYGMDDEAIRAEVLTFHAYNAQHGTFSKNWSATWQMWCARWKDREAAKPKQAKPRVEVNYQPSDEHWDRACKLWAKNNSTWSYKTFGPEPGQLGCKCPREFLTKYHIDPQTGLVAAPSKEPVS